MDWFLYDRDLRHCSSVFVVNFEHTSHLFQVFLFVDFEQVNVCWEPFNAWCPLKGHTYLTQTCRANQWTGFYMISASVMKGFSMYDPPFSGHQMLKGLQKSRFSMFFVLKRFLGFFVIIQRVNEKGFLFKFLKSKKMLSSNIS